MPKVETKKPVNGTPKEVLEEAGKEDEKRSSSCDFMTSST